jgi:L-threonylcarbamoyladenylate synthase
MTTVLTIDPDHPDHNAIEQAAAILWRGGLVAFPTETVYGLGANALNPDAVAGIFRAKGRPQSNPVIVHAADTEAARALVTEWPETAQRLADAFWPGPLTMVLPKAPSIPDSVTAGGPTVAIRVPANRIAHDLLVAAGVPIAAPSANRSESVSPTRAQHVLRGLEGRIDLILDGGPTAGGLESTVVALLPTVRILRPGLITLTQIAEFCPEVSYGQATGSILASPGMMPRHYAPRAVLEVSPDHGEDLVVRHIDADLKVGWITTGAMPEIESDPAVITVTLPADAAGYAAEIYAAIHSLDDAGVDRIVVSRVPEGDDWAAVRDRLARAAAPKTEPPHG